MLPIVALATLLMSPMLEMTDTGTSPTEKPPTEFNALIAILRSFYYYIYHGY